MHINERKNTGRRRFLLRKNNEADKTSDPIQSNPLFLTKNWTQSNAIQSNPWMNPIHVQLCFRPILPNEITFYWRRIFT